jgi:hypothetical protein
MVASSVAPLAITTTSLPTAVEGSPYHTQLVATGGSDSYTWTLGSQTLPAGLQLNATTGEISGTPSTSTNAAFTITVNDPGPPVQQASTPLSVLVSPPAARHTILPPPPPDTVLIAATISSIHRTASFRYKAIGDATGFQCALIRSQNRARRHQKRHKPAGPRYTRCGSSRRYSHLPAGHYRFYVRATGPGGTDNTPATHNFTMTGHRPSRKHRHRTD